MYKVLGFIDGKELLFEVNGKRLTLKSTLPKADLCFFLGIDAREVNKDLRDKILNEAKQMGVCVWRYRDEEGNITDEKTYKEPGNPYNKYRSGFWINLDKEDANEF